MILRFPLIAPLDLKFKHFISIKVKGGSYMRVEPTTCLLPLATTKHV
jgi:hypothetical protein